LKQKNFKKKETKKRRRNQFWVKKKNAATVNIPRVLEFFN
jgi:hypothetical protein